MNATKYAPGTTIDVSIEVKADTVWITVEDRGMGILAKDKDRIFQRFERAVSSHHYGGLGLGLFITRQIVESAGGTIDVTSEPGKGALFTVCLPIKTTKPLFTHRASGVHP
jgi:two-component system OmpR family sensor kinase